MTIPYTQDEDTINDVEYFIDTKEMLEWFDSIGQLSGKNYADKVYDMCNYATAYVGGKLSMITDDIEVHEGVFGMMGNHTWIQVGGVIIDTTLQQFLVGAHKLSIIDANWKEYHSCKKYTFDEWIETSPNLQG